MKNYENVKDLNHDLTQILFEMDKKWYNQGYFLSDEDKNTLKELKESADNFIRKNPNIHVDNIVTKIDFYLRDFNPRVPQPIMQDDIILSEIANEKEEFEEILVEGSGEDMLYAEDVLLEITKVEDMIRNILETNGQLESIKEDVFRISDKANEVLNLLDEKDVNYEKIFKAGSYLASSYYHLLNKEEQLKFIPDIKEEIKVLETNLKDTELIKQQAIAKTPIRYACAKIVDTCRDTVKDITNAQKTTRAGVYDVLDKISAAKDAAKLTVDTSIYQTKTFVKDSAESILRNSIDILEKTKNDFSNFYKNTKEKTAPLLEASHKFLDKTIDMFTLGVYSKVQEKLCKDKGKDDTYWKEINDTGFLWGKTEDNDYIRSPYETAKDASAKMVKTAVSVKNKIHSFSLNFQATCLEKMASLSEKQEKKIDLRISNLENVNKALYESREKLNQSLNALMGQPQVKTPYVRDAQIQAAMDSLNMQKATDRTIYKQLLKEEIKREKAYDLQEEAKLNDVALDIEELQELLDETDYDIQRNEEKLDKMYGKILTNQVSAEMRTEKAQSLREQAQNLENDGPELA